MREFFTSEEEEEEQNDARFPFHCPSTWMPPKGRDAALETYIRSIRTDVEYQLDTRQAFRSRDNLPSEERLALKNLRHRDDIIIKPADKGSGGRNE